MTKSKIHTFLYTITLLFSFLMLQSTTVNATEASVTPLPAGPANLKQSAAYYEKIYIQWTAVANAEYYEVEWSTDQENWLSEPCLATAQAKKTETYWIMHLTRSTTYYTRVRTIYLDGTASEWTNPIEITTASSGLATKDITCTSLTTSKIKLQWKAASGAQAYVIRFSKTSSFKNVKPIATVKTTSFEYSLANYLEPSGYFLITPIRYTTVNKSKLTWRYHAGATYKFNTIMQAPDSIRITGINYSKKSVTFTFNRTKAQKIATSYELEILDGAGKSISKSTILNSQNPTLVVNNSLLFTQPFMYRMRSVCTNATTKKSSYSVWSALTTYTPDAACKGKLTKKNNKKKRAYLKFQKITGATNYTVYYSTNRKTWKAIATTKKTTVRVKYNKKKKNYYYVKANNIKFGNRVVNSVNPEKAVTTYKLK